MKRPIRVAYIVHAFHAGGLERSVARLTDVLDRERFSPLIICLDCNGNAAKWIESDDVPILELRKGSGNNLALPWRLASIFKEQQVDIAHSHNWGTLVETSIACRMVRPRVRHVHAERGTVLGQLVHRGFRYTVRRRIMQVTVRLADVVLSNAEATAERVASTCGISDAAIRIIPNGVAPSLKDETRIHHERARIRQQFDLSDEGVLVGSIGRLVAVKGLETSIRAIASALKSGADLHYVLIGDGPERVKLQSTVQELDIEQRVHFVGEQADVGPWLAALDICLNTSISEGMSQTLVEAMSMGLPLIVTDVGDSRLLVERDGPCGRVAPASADSVLAEHLRELAVNRPLRLELGAKAKAAHAKYHSLSVMAAAYEKLYEMLWEPPLRKLESLSGGDLASCSASARGAGDH